MLASIGRLRWRDGRRLAVAVLAVGATGVSAAPALAAAPEWGITMTHENLYGTEAAQCPGGHEEPECGVDPFSGSGKSFARESKDFYTITVKNSGTANAAGKVTVTDHLPAGMAFGPSSEGPATVATGWNCMVPASGTRSVECSREASEQLEPGKSYPPITLEVYVEPQAAPPITNVAILTNRAEVQGGGAAIPASTTQQEGETTITPAVPFGIFSFTSSIVESLGKPFSQAGGHPFSQKTVFVLNPTIGQVQSTLVVAESEAKEAEVELPPGFIGNPQNTPRCPLELLELRCPANTAVGYVHISQAGLDKGKVTVNEGFATSASSLLYNMEPTPGQPAEFGFFAFEGIPFLLEVKVRSGRDYGVTVGDKAITNGGGRVGGTAVTVCENGVSGTSPNFSCSPAPPSSKPFFTNSTECASSAPVWTLNANQWNEPADRVSKTVYTGGHLSAGAPSASESFATNCNLLQFQPEIEFTPSPAAEGGTSQADEPTGMTINLKVPQTNEAAVNATPELKNAVMTLPTGLTVSPSAAEGLQACTKAKFWPSAKAEHEEAEGKVPQQEEVVEHREPAVSAKCPHASQIGTVEVFTPLLSGAPTIEGVPALEGVPIVGRKYPRQELTCSQGAWSGSPELSYQWLRNGVAISGATSREYAPEAPQDKEQALQCQVTAKNLGGSSVAVSRPAVVLPEPATAPPFPPPSLTAPSGSALAGSTLTCTSGAWTGSPKFSFRWVRGGVVIAGEESEKYTLTSEDVGKVIQCQVTGTNGGTKVGGVVADSAAVVVLPVPSPPPPLPGAALQGQAFQGQPECSPCKNEDAEDGKMLSLFIQAQDKLAGVIVKLHGITKVNTLTGQLTSVFEEQPQQPFELFQLKLKGGPRAPLANPQTCGPATTTAALTPWSAPGLGGLSGSEPIAGTPNAEPSSSFNVEGCPATMPFAPSFNAGTMGPTATTAGVSTDFSVTFGREDREQDLSGVTVQMPPGLVGKIPDVKLCSQAEVKEAEENKPGCSPASEIGTATSGAGPGPDPFFEKGKVYLTGPYKGAPFGLAVVTPAVAGPFNLGNVVVRAAITINRNTAAVTVTSDPLPQFVDGVQLRLRTVNVEVNKPGFMLNPTNCSEQQVSTTLGGLQGASAQVASNFGLTGCKSLLFHPDFTATTQANTSKANGASLDVKITYPQGAYANIAKTLTELPTALPSRLTTLQKACVDTVFEANPAACPEGSVIGQAIVHTPVLNQPLVGPAYLVSHGGAAFPDVEIVLQGEGVEVILDGQTDIKKGITKTTFNAVPDSPISTFELNFPEGPHSILAANTDLCSGTLNMPTTLTGQNGAVIKQTTHIAVIGCPPTVSIATTKLSGNALLVTVKTSAKGTVWISGYGLKTTKRNLVAGTYQIRVPFTKAGISRHKHHKKTSVRVKLTVGKQAVVAKAATVRL